MHYAKHNKHFGNEEWSKKMKHNCVIYFFNIPKKDDPSLFIPEQIKKEYQSVTISFLEGLTKKLFNNSFLAT